jgi:peptidoglycan/LPS O-acetylase OafA/YrhL
MAAKKNLGLEGLRGIASLIVAIGHFTFVFFPYLGSVFTPVPGSVPAFNFERWVQYPPFSIFFSAEAAVCVFFVMSGYVLTTKFLATDNVSVLQAAASKRYLRLVLPSCASVIFAWALATSGAIITRDSATIGVAGWVPAWYVGPFSFFGALFDGLIGAPLFAHTSLNPPLWTIQVELIGSIFLFSMLAVFGRRLLPLTLWSIFFAALLGFMSPNMLFYVSFLVGAMLNYARPWLLKRPALCAVFALIGLIGLAYSHNSVFAFLRVLHLPNLSPYGPNFDLNQRLFWNTAGAILLVSGVIGSARVNQVFSERIPVYLGKISFSLYVVHVPILMSVGLRTARWAQSHGCSFLTSSIFAFSVYMATALVVATLFQRFVDRPSIAFADAVSKRGSFKVADSNTTRASTENVPH